MGIRNSFKNYRVVADCIGYFVLLLPIPLQLQGCKSASAESPQPPFLFEVIHEASTNEFADVTHKLALVITDDETYERELLKRTSDPRVDVDFEKESLLLLGMGEKSTGGYSIEVTLFDDESHLSAHVAYVFPGRGCEVSQALSNPYKFIKVESTQFITVREKIRYSTC